MGTVKPFEGDMDDYRALMTGGASQRKEKREADKASKADKRREAARKRAELEPIAKKIKTAEGLMERLRKRIDAIEAEMADPSLYARDPAKVSTLAKERSDLSAKLETQEELWLQLSSDYEEAMAG
jgi:ATP-binding cassette subfamily F protein 3